MGHAYLTYFDANYAAKGVAMIRSLLRHDPDSSIRVLCLDAQIFNILLKMDIPGVVPARLAAIEQGDAELAKARGNRSRVEYYWTLTPTALLRFLTAMQPGEVLTYVDADMLFFSSLAAVYGEMEGKSVLIHRHNFPPAYAAFNVNGEFNVGLVSFRNDADGRKVLDWWRKRCLEWCYDRCEDGKMGDQKYLEHFTALSGKVAIAQNPGIGVAPWNFTGYELGEKDGAPTVNSVPVVFYHYHSTAFLAPGCIAPCTDLHYPCTTAQLRLFMVPYLQALDSALAEIRKAEPGFASGFRTSGLTAEMCLVGLNEQAEAFREDYPCIVPLTDDYMACASRQYPEGLRVCGPVIKAGGLSWTGDYADWASAAKAAGGYDDQAVFTRVKAAAAAVRDGKALWERDSALFQHEEWNWPLLAALFAIAAQNNGKLQVLDFGGAFGSTYMQHRRAFELLSECVWHVVEQEHFVKAGQAEFAAANLRFHPGIEDALREAPVNVILLSSVLQYLPDAWAFLRKALKTRLPVILDRTPTLPDSDRITVQHVPTSIYKASYPCRWLSKKRLEWLLRNAGYRLSPWWQSAVDPAGFLGVLAMPAQKEADVQTVEVKGRLRVMQVDDFYGAYLDQFYNARPGLGAKSSGEQSRELLRDGFSAIHSIAPYLDEAKFETAWFVPQALPLQRAWAMEQNIPFPAGDWQMEMARQRIENFRPDVLYLPDPVQFSGEFIASLRHRPRLVLSWKAADLPFNIDLTGYDIILSGLPKLLEFAKTRGAKKGVFFKPGMPQWLARAVAGVPQTVDVCFAGSISPSQHGERLAMLDALAKSAAAGVFSLALHLNCSPDAITPAMRPFVRDAVFGLSMQKALAAARIVIDSCGGIGIIDPAGKRIVDLAGSDTINMRLFEATGGGSFLLTENRPGLARFFTPGAEVDVWDDYADLPDKIAWWLAHDTEREQIAKAGQTRCLQEHSMEIAAKNFADIILKELN